MVGVWWKLGLSGFGSIFIARRFGQGIVICTPLFPNPRPLIWSLHVYFES